MKNILRIYTPTIFFSICILLVELTVFFKFVDSASNSWSYWGFTISFLVSVLFIGFILSILRFPKIVVNIEKQAEGGKKVQIWCGKLVYEGLISEKVSQISFQIVTKGKYRLYLNSESKVEPEYFDFEMYDDKIKNFSFTIKQDN